MECALADGSVAVEGEQPGMLLSSAEASAGPDEAWRPASPFQSGLPANWGEAQQIAAVDAAWYDLCHIDQQLHGVYANWTPEQWQQAVQSQLLTGDTFKAGSWQRHATVWRHYFRVTGMLGLPVVQRVLPWLVDGYRSVFVSPFAACQQAHPKYQQRLSRLCTALARVVGAQNVSHYLHQSEPLPVRFENSSSCEEHAEFVQGELANFCSLSALVPWDQHKHGDPVVHPMSVAVHPNTGKLRLCIDANYVNVFETYSPVQFELLPDVFPLIAHDDWCFVTDCTKGYFHLALHPSFQRFVSVAFAGQTYVFTVLPFGLSSAVKAYSSVMQAMYTPMRMHGMRFSFMIDDRLGLARGYNRCWLDILILIRFACSLGCHFGIPKCILWPQRRAQYLGMILDLLSKQCCIPAAKLAKFDAAVAPAIATGTVTARQLASIAGMLVGFAVAVPLSKLYTHQLFLALTGQLAWDQALPVDAELTAHLSWLQQYVPAHNGKRWMQRRPGVVLVSDASVKGVGGLAAAQGGVLVEMQGQLPVAVQAGSSTCREAAGILTLLNTLLADPGWQARLQHRAVKVLSDNQSVVADIAHMRGVGPVFAQVQQIYELCAAHDIDLLVEWRPREDMLLQHADWHSKDIDTGDWGVSPQAYHRLCEVLQCLPAVDWFARPWSAKCAVFYCRYMMQGAAGVDAFDHCWALPSGQVSYICPPHMIVDRVLRKVIDDKADCVLVLPAWFKVWHGMLSELPIQQQLVLPGTEVQWGDRAPVEKCEALNTGLRVYLVRWTD